MPIRHSHLVVAGASGVIGAAAVEHFAAREGWSVTGLSRRRPVLGADCVFEHVGVDFNDVAACQSALASRPPATHLVYAAVEEAPGLVAGWSDDALIERNTLMFANVLDVVVREGFEHLILLQGAKAYGAHRHDVGTPLRESLPRDAHANFYWRQEDETRRRARQHGFSWTIFRPQVLLGAAPGAAMNPVAAIGAYAALCKALHRPFVYPGAGRPLLELVDAGLLAEAFEWATRERRAHGEIFNITNGDVFAPEDAWPLLAAQLGLAHQGPPLEGGLAGFFAAQSSRHAWSQLAEQHDLGTRSLEDLLGQSHHYLDLLLSARLAARALPVLLSTIKVRQAGFAPCRDSAASLLFWLHRMSGLKLLPPLHA